jgi:hypothetical protein
MVETGLRPVSTIKKPVSTIIILIFIIIILFWPRGLRNCGSLAN